jgi:NADH:ubiquinone oxidoreductase subunit F (NADH-binding)
MSLLSSSAQAPLTLAAQSECVEVLTGCCLLPAGDERLSLRQHGELHGPLPEIDGPTMSEWVASAGLTGRGGAGFPTDRKIQAVLGGPAPRVVVANGAEGEPASNKDKTLLGRDPHLVLDGLDLAARAVAATRTFIYVHDEPGVVEAVRAALGERVACGIDRHPAELVTAPPRFVSGEESAVASRVSGGPALPQSRPPRMSQAGVFGRPTLINNVETLAHMALIARYGVAGFRSSGHPDQPGTMLFTVSGGVRCPGVVEAPTGIPLGDVVDLAGGLCEPASAVLIGGFHGSWTSWSQGVELVMANPVLRPDGLAVGAGVVAVLPASRCGLVESERVVRYLAQQSAGQCGPCVFGMPRMADAFARVVDTGRSRANRRLAEASSLLDRRGGCSHPDGSLRFVRSASAVFAAEVAMHARGGCSASDRRRVLPTPGL